MSDYISRQAAIAEFSCCELTPDGGIDVNYAIEFLMNMPSVQPFHNTTMSDVLEYIDGMPEDVWQEFTACLECRGWELRRRTAKWCGSEFA